MTDTAKRSWGKAALNALKVVCFILVFFAVLIAAQNVLIAKIESKYYRVNAQTSYWNEFHNLEKNTLDILFVGSSITYCGVDPMYLYNETGAYGYDLASGSARYDTSYLMLEEALKTQSPKVVMLEASSFRYQGDTDEAKYHRGVDNLGLSYDKLAVTSENNWEEGVDLLGFAFPIFRYHSRWDNLTEDDWYVLTNGIDETYQRGHAPASRTTEVTRTYNKEGWEPYDRNYKYMDKIYDLCQENGIKLIIYKIPSVNWGDKESEAMREYAESKGIEYYDYCDCTDEIGLDTKTDYYDEIGHLNQNGCEKFMAYFIDNLLSTLDLPDHRGDASNWDEDYQKYLEVKDAWKAHGAVPLEDNN